MRPALSLLRMIPAVGLTAGLAACADPPSAPTAAYVPARYTSSWSSPVQSYYQPGPPAPSRPPAPYYYVTPRPSPRADDVEVPHPQPAPRMAEPQPAPSPTKPWLSWLAPPAEAAPAPRPAQPEPSRGVPPGDECGYWRLCNMPGWRYAY